jgi:phosphopantetheinyl transferase (holo-ACP synthase)
MIIFILLILYNDRVVTGVYSSKEACQKALKTQIEFWVPNPDTYSCIESRLIK